MRRVKLRLAASGGRGAEGQGVLSFEGLLGCTYPEILPAECAAVAEWAAAATEGRRRPAPAAGVGPLRDLLTPEQREAARDSFAFLNKAGNGMLSYEELERQAKINLEF